MSTAAPPMTEADLQRGVLDLARACGWLAYHTYDSRRSAHGWPDLALARNGRLLLVELKSETGRLTTGQELWLAELRLVASASHGAVEVHIWRPADWHCGVIDEALR